MRLIFCGTPQFAVPTLEAVLEAGHVVPLVLTQPDRPSGRGLDVQVSAVKQFALEQKIPVEQPDKIRTNQALEQKLRAISPHAILVVAYGRLIPPWMLELPRHGNLNLHASLLPKYRGAAPIQWAIANGESETGVTTMRLDEGMDTGDILLQETMPILPEQTAVEISPALARMGADLMVRTLEEIERGTLKPEPQDASRATAAPILTREDGQVDWTRTAREIYDRWRGFQPWPGAYTNFRGRKLILHVVRALDGACSSQNKPPGAVVRNRTNLLVACGEGTCLEIVELQMEGKRRMPADAFLNGVALAAGERLG